MYPEYAMHVYLPKVFWDPKYGNMLGNSLPVGLAQKSILNFHKYYWFRIVDRGLIAATLFAATVSDSQNLCFLFWGVMCGRGMRIGLGVEQSQKIRRGCGVLLEGWGCAKGAEKALCGETVVQKGGFGESICSLPLKVFRCFKGRP